MRSRDKYNSNKTYGIVVLLLGIITRLHAKPTTIFAEIITPSNLQIEQWEHVNKTCQNKSGDCNDIVNVAHLRDLQRHMRIDIEPCENFYQYACGNWAHDEKYHSSVNMMKYGDEQVVQQYVQLFQQAIQTKQHHRQAAIKNAAHKTNPWTNDPIFEKILLYYNICQRAQQTPNAINLRGYVDALHTLGIWNANDSWFDTLSRLGRYGYAEHYLQLHIKQKNVSHHEVQILPHNKEVRAKLDYEIYNIINIYTHYDYEHLQAAFVNLENELESIVKNTSADCASTELDEDNECDLFKTYTLAELKDLAPTINWQRFIGLHLGALPHEQQLFTVDDLNTIVRLVNYIDHMDKELRTIYTVVRFLNYIQLHMQKLRIPLADSYNLRCVRHMRKTLYLPMLYVYEQTIYKSRRADNDRVINEIFQQLKTEFAHKLNRNEMNFTNRTLNFLRAKLQTLRLNLGNLPRNVSEEFYMNYISNLNVSGNFYFNHLNALQHFYAHLRLLAANKHDDAQWYTFNQHSPDMPDNVDSTAYYFVLSNMIVMPYAYLQPPFYDARFWPALLYGDLANTLGHEMMHAFDNNFLYYDYAGNMVENYREVFANAEFSRRLNTLRVGTKFLSERIADISGSHLALSTFLSDTRFRNSNGRLYFLQFAQFFCGSEENLSELTTYDPTHDVNSLRLNYVLSHLAEFSQIYKCKENSAMNLKERFIMW